MNIKEISEAAEKQRIARRILEALPEWFGIPEAREDYIRKSSAQVFFAAYDADAPIGFICLEETGRDAVELYVMGVLREYHRRGVGSKLFAAAKERAAEKGYSFLQVKTVQMGRYETYDDTNRFYLAMGFKATPYNSGAQIAPSDFSSGSTKSAGNTSCIAEHFCAV